MSEEPRGKATTLFGRVIHSAEEWKAIEDAMAKADGLLAERGRELADLAQKHDALARRLQEAQQALAQERANSAQAQHGFAASLSELRAKLEQDAKAAESARQRAAEEAKAAIDGEAGRAQAAEQRARGLEARLAELDEENAKLAEESAAKLDRLAKESAATAKAVEDGAAALESAIRDRDALRQKLEAVEAAASAAGGTIGLLEKARGEIAQGAARAEADRARTAARAALVGRLVGGLGALATFAFGAGSQIVWRWSTSGRGGALRAADVSGVLEALGVGTEVALEIEESGSGVLRYTAAAGAETPGWVVAMTEAILFHETGRSHTGSVSRDQSGNVVVRFEAAEG